MYKLNITHAFFLAVALGVDFLRGFLITCNLRGFNLLLIAVRFSGVLGLWYIFVWKIEPHSLHVCCFTRNFQSGAEQILKRLVLSHNEHTGLCMNVLVVQSRQLFVFQSYIIPLVLLY